MIESTAFRPEFSDTGWIFLLSQNKYCPIIQYFNIRYSHGDRLDGQVVNWCPLVPFATLEYMKSGS